MIDPDNESEVFTIMKKKMIAGIMAAALLAGCGAQAGELLEEPTIRNEENEKPPVVSEGTVNLTEGAEVINVNFEEGDYEEEWIRSLSGASMNMLVGVSTAEGEGKNILISPTSIMTAFGMAENGANGETLEQMENVIGGGVTREQMNQILYSMSRHLENSEDVEWNVANSIWFNDNGEFKVVPDFAAYAKTYYNADIWSAPFGPETINDINGWVNNETRGMIPTIINELDPDAKMFLVNAMAFEGEWENEYEEGDICENQTFTNYNGSTSEVTMLFSEESGYFRYGGGIGFTRPYEGGEYSFFAILPDEGVSVEEMIAKANEEGDDLSHDLTHLKRYDGDIYVYIPEFKNDYELNMNQVLQDLGITTAFDPVTADFTSMMQPVEDVESQIWISSVIHKTFIEVNREGTRAAAVTGMMMDATCALEEYHEPMIINLNRPFVYGIVDNETGLPIFVGYLNTIE